MKKRFLSLVLALAMTLGLALPASVSPSLAADSPAVSNNRNTQDYTTFGNTVKSYLYENPSGGLTRVEYIGGEIVVEDYDSSFRLQDSRTIPMELSIWGGFFAGEDYNFFVFGQKNPSESDSVEVLRVVKYSKSWERLDQASLRGINTTIPFNGGSLRCDETSDYLYIITCHEMYKYTDGYNHQANMTICLDKATMTVADSFTQIGWPRSGYVSHSLNQFILIDQDDYIVAVDHGDADPTRGVTHTRYYSKASTGKFTGAMFAYTCSSAPIFPFAGTSGDNTTGASIGGLAETEDCYVMAYSYNGTGRTGGDRTPYFQYMDKASGRSWITEISEGKGCSTPVLASAGLKGGYMLWNGKSGYNTFSDTLGYLAYGADGKPGRVQTAKGSLSDCRPIPYNGGVVWYTTSNSAPVFYILDGSGVTAVETVPSEPEPAPSEPKPSEPEPSKPEPSKPEPSEPEPAPSEPPRLLRRTRLQLGVPLYPGGRRQGLCGGGALGPV